MIIAKADIFYFFMVLTRILGLVVLVPFFGGRVIPVQLRLALGAGLALFVYPMVYNPDYVPEHPLVILFFLLTEVLMGILMGFAVRLVFYIAEFSGAIISMETSLTRSDVFDPLMQSHSTTVGTVLFYICVMLMFVTDVHHDVLRVFVESYRNVPVGGIVPVLKNVNEFAKATSSIFLVGLKIAAPIVALSFVINVTFAVLGKAVPKMNVFITSFPIKILGGLGLLFFSSGLIFQYFYHYVKAVPKLMASFISF